MAADQQDLDRWKAEVMRLACQATNAAIELDNAREHSQANLASLAMEAIGNSLHRLADSIETAKKKG